MIFTVTDIAKFKQKSLKWAAGFDVCCFFDSNDFIDPYGKYDAIIASGVQYELMTETGNAFAELERFRQQHSGWMTGFFTYDLKSEIEQLSSNNPDCLQFPDLYFFVPKHLITIKGNQVEIVTAHAKDIFRAIDGQVIETFSTKPSVTLKSRFSKEDYITIVKQIQEHITRGDIYVSNFCQEFFAEDVKINALDVYCQLNELSPNPFSCFFKYHQQYIICASPERFLAKTR